MPWNMRQKRDKIDNLADCWNLLNSLDYLLSPYTLALASSKWQCPEVWATRLPNADVHLKIPAIWLLTSECSWLIICRLFFLLLTLLWRFKHGFFFFFFFLQMCSAIYKFLFSDTSVIRHVVYDYRYYVDRLKLECRRIYTPRSGENSDGMIARFAGPSLGPRRRGCGNGFIVSVWKMSSFGARSAARIKLTLCAMRYDAD